MEGIELRLCSKLPAVQQDALKKLGPLFQTKEQSKEAWRLLSKLVLECKLSEFACIRALESVVPVDRVISIIGQDEFVQVQFQWIKAFSSSGYRSALDSAVLCLLKLDHEYLGRLLIVNIENRGFIGDLWNSLYNILSSRESNGINWKCVSYVVRLVLLADSTILPFNEYRASILSCFEGEDLESVFNEIILPMIGRLDSSLLDYRASELHALLPKNQFNVDALFFCMNIACNHKNPIFISFSIIEKYSEDMSDLLWITDKDTATCLYKMTSYLLLVSYERLNKIQKRFLNCLLRELLHFGVHKEYIWTPLLVELKIRNLEDESDSLVPVIEHKLEHEIITETSKDINNSAVVAEKYLLDGVCRQLVLGNLGNDCYANLLLLNTEIMSAINNVNCIALIDKFLLHASTAVELHLDIVSFFNSILNVGKCVEVQRYILLQAFPKLIKGSNNSPFVTSNIVAITKAMINSQLPTCVAMGLKSFYECSLVDNRLWPLLFPRLSALAGTDLSKIEDINERTDILTAFLILKEACETKGDQILPIFANVLLRDYRRDDVTDYCLEGINVLIEQDVVTPFSVWKTFLSKVHQNLQRNNIRSAKTLDHIFKFYTLVGDWKSNEDVGNLFKTEILTDVLLTNLKSENADVETKVRSLNAISYFPAQDILAVASAPTLLDFIRQQDAWNADTEHELAQALSQLCFSEISNMRRSVLKGSGREVGGNLESKSKAPDDIESQLKNCAQLFTEQLANYWLTTFDGHPGMRNAFTRASFIFMPSIISQFQKGMASEEIDKMYSICLAAGIEDLNVTSADHSFLKLRNDITAWNNFFLGFLPCVLKARYASWTKDQIQDTDSIVKHITDSLSYDLIETRFQKAILPKNQCNIVQAGAGFVLACTSLQLPFSSQLICSMFAKLFSLLQVAENEELIISLLDALCSIMENAAMLDQNLVNALIELCLFLHKKWQDRTTTFSFGCVAMSCMKVLALSGPLLSSNVGSHLRETWISLSKDLSVLMTMRRVTTERIDQEHGPNTIFGFLLGISLINTRFIDVELETIYREILDSSVKFLNSADSFGNAAETRQALFIGAVYLSLKSEVDMNVLLKLLKDDSGESFSEILVCSCRKVIKDADFDSWKHLIGTVFSSYETASVINKTDYLVASKYLLGFENENASLLETVEKSAQTFWRVLNLLLSEVGVDRKSMQNMAKNINNIRIARVALSSLCDVLSNYVNVEVSFDIEESHTISISQTGWITEYEPKNLDRLSSATSFVKWIYDELKYDYLHKNVLIDALSRLQVPIPAVDWQSTISNRLQNTADAMWCKFMINQSLYSQSMSKALFSSQESVRLVIKFGLIQSYWKVLLESYNYSQISKDIFLSRLNNIFLETKDQVETRHSVIRALIDNLQALTIQDRTNSILLDFFSSEHTLCLENGHYDSSLLRAELLYLTSSGDFFMTLLPDNYVSAPAKPFSPLLCCQILHTFSLYNNSLQKKAYLTILYNNILVDETGCPNSRKLLDFWCSTLKKIAVSFKPQEREEWILDILDCLSVFFDSFEIDPKWFVAVFENSLAAISGLKALSCRYVFYDSISNAMNTSSNEDTLDFMVKIVSRLLGITRNPKCPPEIKESIKRLCSIVRGNKFKSNVMSIFQKVFKGDLGYYIELFTKD